MADIVLTHKGANKESAAARAVLEYYGNTVEERVVSFSELLPLSKGHARIVFEFRGKTYYNLDEFIRNLASQGHTYL